MKWDEVVATVDGVAGVSCARLSVSFPLDAVVSCVDRCIGDLGSCTARSHDFTGDRFLALRLVLGGTVCPASTLCRSNSSAAAKIFSHFEHENIWWSFLR